MAIFNASSEWLVIAHARTPWSVRGHIKIEPFAEWETLQKIRHWRWLCADGAQSRDLLCCECLRLNGVHPAIRFEGIETRASAEELKHGVFYAQRSALPHLAVGEYYWGDLIGLSVGNLAGDHLGVVESVDENPANVFLNINRQGKIFAIPFVKSYIVAVDIAQSRMVVDWQRDWD